MRVILFLVFSFFLPWHLHADSRIKINLVYVDGPGGLTYPEYYQLALDLRKYLQREIDLIESIIKYTKERRPDLVVRYRALLEEYRCLQKQA